MTSSAFAREGYLSGINFRAGGFVRASYIGPALLLGVPLLLSGLWSCLIWMLRRKERLGRG